MTISIYNDFSDYMTFNGINNVERIEVEFKYKNTKIGITEGLIINQFDAMRDFHEKAMGFNGYVRNKLNNNTGKVVEEYKVSIRKLSADINIIKSNGAKNSFEELIVKYGDKFINKGEECIREIYKSDYIGIITRSMRRTEICLGDTDFRNLGKDNLTNVVSFGNCSYNMLEMDCFFLLSRLKRKGMKLDFKKLAKEFCYIEGLNENSSEFLIALISYPYEFVRCCNKYRVGKNKWNEEKFPEKLIKTIIEERDFLP
ncbi:hypothetical protein LGK97_05565 [Clostridium sp. CS001]|uniref:hypothetical protein n=1 Tax=Clostridium sp. CS001 TaxID=2880648 RepID=UPI001CF12E22|nr:hypothetical protein [Clostridium sp. CS001]MCB2289231.1 hypothetical protein [Clostridium sp. CS001]